MQNKKVNPIVQWWMTPKLPYQDIYDLPLLKSNGMLAKYSHLFSKWLIHPIKRRLAKKYLEILRAFTDIKVIGITGSAGKSTTTQLIYSILKLNSQTVATPHSIDPVYNIPNTILQCSFRTKYLILEMSVEYPSEMDYYLWIVVPDMGVILNIFPSHLANLGDVEGVFVEKSKLVKSLDKKSTAVLNLNDKSLKTLEGKLSANIKWFEGNIDPMKTNLNAARALAEVLGVNENDIKKGVENFNLPEHRLQLIELPNGAKLLDDTYNSNPMAATSALSYFEKIAAGKKIAILGDMLELGNYEISGHKQLGRKISEMRFDIVIGVGRAIKYTLSEIKKYSKTTTTHALSVADATKILKPLLSRDTFVFVKGSRSIGLDKLVSSLSSSK